jgi:hypothetical protein
MDELASDAHEPDIIGAVHIALIDEALDLLALLGKVQPVLVCTRELDALAREQSSGGAEDEKRRERADEEAALLLKGNGEPRHRVQVGTPLVGGAVGAHKHHFEAAGARRRAYAHWAHAVSSPPPATATPTPLPPGGTSVVIPGWRSWSSR